MPGTLLRTLFFKLFSVKVDTSSIFPTSHTWKMGLREVVHCSVSIALISGGVNRQIYVYLTPKSML